MTAFGRLLSAMLIAVAMLVAPFAMPGTRAAAAMPADHHGQMTDSGHCDEQPASGEDDAAMGDSCCAAMCAAVALAPTGLPEAAIYAGSIDRPSLRQYRHGFLAKLPTPPPRLA